MIFNRGINPLAVGYEANLRISPKNNGVSQENGGFFQWTFATGHLLCWTNVSHLHTPGRSEEGWWALQPESPQKNIRIFVGFLQFVEGI